MTNIREQFGYGISTQFDKPAVDLGLGEQNTRILAGLASTDQVAYLRTLYGENDRSHLRRFTGSRGLFGNRRLHSNSGRAGF